MAAGFFYLLAKECCLTPYYRNRRSAEPSAESLTPEERRFAEVVLGKVIRTERETLEWVAKISDRHAVELNRLREAEAAAQGQPSTVASSLSFAPFASESGGRPARGHRLPRSLAKFEAWNDALLRELRELEAEVRAMESRAGCGPVQRVLDEDGWDAAKHPRLGTSPNPGWFASSGGGGRGGAKPPLGDTPLYMGIGAAAPAGTGRSLNVAPNRSAGNAPDSHIALAAPAAPRSVRLSDRWLDQLGKTLGKFGLKTIDDLNNAPNGRQALEAAGNALASYIKQLIDSGESADDIRDFLNGSPSARRIMGVPPELRGPGLRFRKEGKRYTITLTPGAHADIRHGHFDAGVGFNLTISW